MASTLHNETLHHRKTFDRSESWGEKYTFQIGIKILVPMVYYAIAGTTQDIFYSVSFLAFQNRGVMSTFIGQLGSYMPILLLGISVVTLFDVWFTPSDASNTSTWKGPARPYLIPCKTSHRRLTPEKHSFSYSYLAVGIPVGYKGNINGMMTVEDESQRWKASVSPFRRLFSKACFSVKAADYLQRDCDHLDLRGKLDLYLESQGLQPTLFPYAYLVTAPSVLGYQFNPVSFWYLYSPAKTLSAIIFEVNNTFDERRPYIFLRDLAVASEDLKFNQQVQITGSRAKDFYVSPFNSRDGNYTIRTSDPLGPGMEGFRGMDVTITLNLTSGHPKMVARLSSDGEAVDPALINTWSKIIFLSKWSWVGFTTFPRIIKEACILLVRRKLSIWQRPEPLPGTLGRDPTSLERCLKTAFVDYLQHTVKMYEKPVTVKFYEDGLANNPGFTFTSPKEDNAGLENIVKVRILTPMFYSRFVRYTDSVAALRAESTEKGTISIDWPELLLDIFGSGKNIYASQGIANSRFQYVVNQMRRDISQKSSNPASMSPERDLCLSANQGDQLQMASIDAYMDSHKLPTTRRHYQWAVIRQLVSDCYFMGYVDPLHWATTIFRIAVSWLSASMLRGIMAYILQSQS